jgi:outer membrane lipase/esterase
MNLRRMPFFSPALTPTFKQRLLRNVSPLGASFGLSAAIGVAACNLSSPAQAQGPLFDQVVVFGDEAVDSGFLKNQFPGAGTPTTNPGLSNSQILAGYFGLTANPGNQPGGTNFANAGADLSNITGPLPSGVLPIAIGEQLSSYFGTHKVDRNSLYLISNGESSIAQIKALKVFLPTVFPTDPPLDIVGAAQVSGENFASRLSSFFQNSGARYIVLPNLFFIPSADAETQAARTAYGQAVWAGAHSLGLNFVPADFDALGRAVAANPNKFGLTNVTDAACSNPTGIPNNWALGCTPAQLVAPNADKTFLFADDHNLTSAGQKIEADYLRSLLLAPSQISLLAENAVQARTATVGGMQQQIDIIRRRATPGFNVWANGDVASLQLDTGLGVLGSGVPFSGTLGMDYRTDNGFLVGGALTAGSQTSKFDLGGNFTQRETAVSAYSAYFNGPTWLSVIGTYGGSNYDDNRVVPIGISLQASHGATHGNDVSLAFQGGYDFQLGNLTHGPVAGFTWQRAKVDGFTEIGDFTSLGFGNQVRQSAISSLGYKANLDLGRFRPFAQVTWDHELGMLDRLVSASLTTKLDAPSFALPAAALGRDWVSGTLGTAMTLAPNFTGLASVTARAGQTGATIYGGNIGLNYALGATDTPPASIQSGPVAPVGATPWAPWISTASSEVRVFSWHDTLTAIGAPASSGSRGSEVYVPYALQMNGKIAENLDVEIVGRGGWVNATNHTAALEGTIGTPLDTTLSTTFTYSGLGSFQPFAAVQTNLPTGTATLLGPGVNTRFDPDLVDITSFGEGFNLGTTLGFNYLLSSSWIFTTSVGYTDRGKFDRELAFAADFNNNQAAPLPTDSVPFKPGSDLTIVQSVSYSEGQFSTRVTGSLSIDSTTFQNGVALTRPGNRYLISNDSNYAWSDVIGTTTLSASATHSNRNDVFDVTSAALVKELIDTNSNVYRASLQHMVPFGAFAVGPTGSYLFRDHNGYDAQTLQFVPAKQRYSAGVLARYTPNANMTFNARVESVWTHEDANPADGNVKFSQFAGGLVPQGPVPAISSRAWQTALGFNYRL